MTAASSPSFRPRATVATVATVVLSALVLAGCSSGEPGAGGTPPEPRSSSPSTSSTPEPRTAPLAEYLGVGKIESTTSDEGIARQVEESIARCMAAEGFEYVPYVLVSKRTPMPDGTAMVEFMSPEKSTLPPEQLAAQYGYGFSTNPPRSETGGLPEDPNEAIVAQMSVPERVAYHQALEGKDVPLDDRGYPDYGDSVTATKQSERACEAKAYAEAPPEQEEEDRSRRIEQVQASFKGLVKRIGDLREEELADARVVAATQEWSQCLATAGFPGFSDLDQPRERAQAEAVALLGPDLDRVDGVDPGRLAELRRTEVRLAVADLECLVAWDETFAAVQRDLEEQFVRANLEELEDYRSAMAAALSLQD